MRGNRFLKVLKILVIVLAVAAVMSLVVMRLWNWLTPALFGWKVITYWQALGILVLSKILFGGFRGGPHRGGHWRERMRTEHGQITEEDGIFWMHPTRESIEEVGTAALADLAKLRRIIDRRHLH